MLGGLKALFIGLPLLAQVGAAGGTTVGISGAAIAIHQSQECSKQPNATSHYSTSSYSSVPPIEHEDGSMPQGEVRIISLGKSGIDSTDHTVTKHCGKFLSDIKGGTHRTQEAIAEVRNVGTYYDVSQEAPIPYGTQAVADPSQEIGTKGIKSAGINGTKRITYRFAKNEGQEQTKTQLGEPVTITPAKDEVSWYGTKAKPVDPGPTTGPTARCADGTYSYSQNHSGTCSHHGGVSVWYR
jgi:hypothetical protein